MTDLFLPVAPRLVTFWLIDLRAWGDDLYCFVDSKQYATIPTVAWNSLTFTSLPIRGAGFKKGEDTARPKLIVPDGGGVMYRKIREYKGASGAPILRYQVSADVVEAGGTSYISFDSFMLNKYGGSAGIQLELELAQIGDLRKSKGPSFVMTRDIYPGLGSALLR